MSQLLLRMEHVSKFYRTVIGVGDLTLELPPGAYGLIGPNGSGKSTLIHLITGVLRPSLGKIRVLGADPARERGVLRKIGLCPASDILFPNISAHQWVAFQTELHGISKAEASQRASQSLERLGLEKRMHEPIGSYSLGMRQRTKLAQATAHDPELLILDEPFNGLDPIGRFELSEFLRQWHDSGRSFILASHVLHEVEAITSRFLLIHGGRILASGDAAEVRSMLSGFPTAVELRGVGLVELARELVSQSWLEGIQFSNGQRDLRVSVSDLTQLQQFLQVAACRPQVNIAGIESPDSDLEGAFGLLLRVHRGEV